MISVCTDNQEVWHLNKNPTILYKMVGLLYEMYNSMAMMSELHNIHYPFSISFM